jgi:ribosomal-protein-alanine N-acetyltransferase
MNETERMTLREPEESDVETLRAYHRRNAERFALWDAVPGDEPEAHLAWIRDHHAARKAKRPVAFLGFDRSTSHLVGLVALSGFNAEPPSAMVNYSVDAAYEGKGYAFEMVAQMARYAFEELLLSSMTASVRVGNERSLRLLERPGVRDRRAQPGYPRARAPVPPARHSAARANTLHYPTLSAAIASSRS